MTSSHDKTHRFRTDDLVRALRMKFEAYKKLTKKDYTTISREAAGNPAFYDRLIDDQGFTIRVAKRVEEFFDENMPTIVSEVETELNAEISE